MKIKIEIFGFFSLFLAKIEKKILLRDHHTNHIFNTVTEQRKSIPFCSGFENYFRFDKIYFTYS